MAQQRKAQQRYYIFKDGQQIGSTVTKEAALDMIKYQQEQEKHPFLKAHFSYIRGIEVL